MADAIELATAYVTLVPSMAGAEKTIADQILPAADSAGLEGGKKFGASWSKALGAAALGAAVVGAFKGLYEVGNIFDEVEDTIRTGTGATGDALDALVASATNVGRTVPAEFSAIGPVIADLNTRLGLSGTTLETVASQYLEAGRVLGEDIDINKTSAAFSAFRIEGDGVVGAMDTLFQISQATGVGMNDLASAVSAQAPAMQNLGFSFEETAALAGSLDKAGLNSTATMASMSRGLITLARDGEEPQEAFRRVTGEIDDLIQSGDTAAAIDLAAGIFGTRGAGQFVGAVQSGTLALDDLIGNVGLSGDTILGVGDDTQDFAEKWQIVKNNALAALEPLGSAVFGALGDVLTSMLPTLTSIGDWLRDNPAVMWAVVAVLGALAVGLGIAAVAQWAMNSALLASPITWIIVGIAALIAGLVLLIANWDTVVAWFKDVWAGIVDWLAGIWDAISDGVTTAWTAVAEFFTGLWDSITGGIEAAWNAVVDFFQAIPGRVLEFFLNWTLPGLLIKHWDTIKATAVAAWNALVDWIKGIPGRFLDGLRAIGNLAGDMAGWVLGVRDAAVEKFLDLVDWVKGLPGQILDGLGNLRTMLLDAGRNIIQGLWDGLTERFEQVKGWVTGIGDWIADHKGPKQYDLNLLVPAGGWIMTGLREGLEAEIPALRDTLGAVSSEIELGATATADTRASVSNALPVDSAGAGMWNVNVEISAEDLEELETITDFFDHIEGLAKAKAGVA